jgi:hypothetical protein
MAFLLYVVVALQNPSEEKASGVRAVCVIAFLVSVMFGSCSDRRWGGR